MIEATRIKSMIVLMSDILAKVEEELQNGPDHTLSDKTIARIAALSYSFKPYAQINGDSIAERKLSPERCDVYHNLTNTFRKTI